MAVDREARGSYARLIRQFVACEITNDEFHDRTPPTEVEDRAIADILGELWFYYDDMRVHKLEGKYALTQEQRDLFDRCILFLESELEYEWPDIHKWGWAGVVEGFGTLLANVVTLGLYSKLQYRKFETRMRSIGDWEVWPFIRREDYESALAGQLT